MFSCFKIDLQTIEQRKHLRDYARTTLPRVLFCDFGGLENSLPDTEPQTNKHPRWSLPQRHGGAEFSEANKTGITRCVNGLPE
jgi:hypothetical protein